MHHVAYGDVSGYLAVPAGVCSLAVRVRVVRASMKDPRLPMSWGGKVIASKLAFASVTPHQAVMPGAGTMSVTAGPGTRDQPPH